MSVVVIGGGPDGLAAAAVLASAGKQVTLLAPEDTLGHTSAGLEFHPGFRHTGVFPDADNLSTLAMSALGLDTHGLTRVSAHDVTVCTPGRDPLTLGAPRLPALVGRVLPFLRKQLVAPAPDLTDGASLVPLIGPALGFRRLGAADMMELLRVAPLSVDDWVAEWEDDPIVASAHMLPPLRGAWMGPRAPTSAGLLLLDLARRGAPVRGGPAAVVAALEAAATSAGATLRTGAGVSQITLDEGRVTGVILENGETLAATAVLSTVGPRRTLMDLVSARELPPRTEGRIRTVRCRGSMAKVHLALAAPLIPTGCSAAPGRLRVVGPPTVLERAWDDVKHGRLPQSFVPLDIAQPTVADPTLAPKGQHVLAVTVPFAAQDIDGGWTEDARKALLDEVLSSLESVAPGARDLVVGHEVLTPSDLERTFGLDGGHLIHGELGLDQLGPLRPAHGLARHRVDELPGLWLGGMGCHPGGWTGGAGGVLAARALLAG